MSTVSTEFLKAFDEFLRQPSPRFVCEDFHSGRTPNPKWVAPIIHRMNPPATAEAIERAERELDIELPASYRHFLMRWNGGILFDQDSEILRLLAPEKPESISRYPIVFYPIEQVPERTREWQANWTRVLHHGMSLKPPKYLRIPVSEFLRIAAEQTERDLEHVPGIVVIGDDFQGGDYFGFDLTPPQLTAEPPLIFLAPSGCSLSEPEILSNNFAEFIQRIVEDPVTVLRHYAFCFARYSDGQTETQWIVVGDSVWMKDDS